ncbi:MAG TPA: hypothetical protein PKH51_07685, partial [Candidatus Sumerlaeota bacterium]|nr:hypothetical protein [Candidatus Sumerlaeota bacterium]
LVLNTTVGTVGDTVISTPIPETSSTMHFRSLAQAQKKGRIVSDPSPCKYADSATLRHFSEWRNHLEVWARFFVARASRPRNLWMATKFRKVL